MVWRFWKRSWNSLLLINYMRADTIVQARSIIRNTSIPKLHLGRRKQNQLYGRGGFRIFASMTMDFLRMNGTSPFQGMHPSDFGNGGSQEPCSTFTSPILRREQTQVSGFTLKF